MKEIFVLHLNITRLYALVELSFRINLGLDMVIWADKGVGSFAC